MGEAAAVPVEVDVILPDCPAAGLAAEALLAALELELGHDGIRRVNLLPAPGTDGEATIEVVLVGGPDAQQVRLRIRGAPDHAAERDMYIADLPRRLRPRGVALAAAELARWAWSSSPRAREMNDAAPPDAGAGADGLAAPSPATADASAVPAAPAAATAAASALPGAATPLRPSPSRPPWGLAAGPAARWFFSAVGPALGGRAAAGVGRWRLGVDVLVSYDARFAAATKLGLATAWMGFEAWAVERGRWRLSTGPRLAAGAGWSRVPTENQQGPLGGPVTASPDPPAAAQSTRGWYVEGTQIVYLQARTASGWLCAAGLELGLGWGIAPGRDSVQPGLRPSAGVNVLAGHGW
jgi:hypothetical protein